MTKLATLVVCAALAVAIGCGSGQTTMSTPPAVSDTDTTAPEPPVADKRDHRVESPHGTRDDPYYWLRDDSRKDPAVLAHLHAENAYADAMLAPARKLQGELYDEMIARLKQDDSSVPVFEDGYWYYYRYETGKQYPLFARRATATGPEELLLDQNKEAEGHDFYKASRPRVSPDGNLMAFVEDTVGRNKFDLRIVDLRTGATLPDTVSNIQGSLAWANDNKTLFYIEKHPTTLLGYRVRRHVLGTDTASDPLVYEEKDTAFYMGLGRTKSDAYVGIWLSSTVSNEYRLIDADKPDSAPRVLLPRERDHEYSAEHLNGRFVFLTNWKARNFRLMEAPEATAGDRSTWKELVPHREDVFLNTFDVYDDFIALSERSGGLLNVRVLPNSGEPFFLEADDAAYTMYLSELPEADSKVVRYTYTSMTTPKTTYEVDVATRNKKMLKRQPVLGDFDPANYTSEFVHATARDGTRIPVSIVYRKGLVKDGTAPVVQYGYGSYGASGNPTFSSARVSLLDRGVVYAIAHIRGGQEMGRAWYEGGKLLNKMNTFTDFVDVTRFLVANKYGAADKVIAMGGSAGGLLVGAVANLAPDDYRGVVAWVPFVDVVTTMLDPSIPLTSNEFDEWGDPRKKPYYDYMLSYSPYDNVAARRYPAMLVTTGLHDSQVQYWEPAKWVARLREHTTSANPILFVINMDAGHGGKSGRYHKLREIARDYAWVLHTFDQPDPRAAR